MKSIKSVVSMFLMLAVIFSAVGTALGANVNVTINQSVDKPVANVGDVVNLTTNITNNGTLKATGINVTVLLPNGFKFLGYDSSSPNNVYDSNTGIWNVTNLNVNATNPIKTKILNIYAEVLPLLAGKTVDVIANISKMDQNTINPSFSSVSVKVPLASLYEITSVSNSNPKVGENLVITFKVKNNGPDAASSTLLKYVVPYGFQFLYANVESGNWDYNQNTRTITWNIGDVPAGDPVMDVVVKVLSSQAIFIKPSLSTATYDPNLINSVSSVTVNAASTVNAAGNTFSTVGMQKTGFPLGILAVAVLLILGGLISPKIKP